MSTLTIKEKIKYPGKRGTAMIRCKAFKGAQTATVRERDIGQLYGRMLRHGKLGLADQEDKEINPRQREQSRHLPMTMRSGHDG